MARSSSLSRKAMKFVFFATGAAVGTLIAISAAKKKGKRLKKGGEKLLKNAKIAVKSTKDRLNKRQREILRLFNKEQQITNEMIQSVITGVTERTIRRDLNFLEEKGYIKKVGKTKGSYYVLR